MGVRHTYECPMRWADMDQLGGVDFEKGCYIGQEVVSRMEHRGTARSRTSSGSHESLTGDPASGEPLGEPGDYKEHVRRYESELIMRALHKHHGNQTEAAKQLGISRRTLIYRMEKYGLKPLPPAKREPPS